MEHQHISSHCLRGLHEYAYCHACLRNRCRNCGAEESLGTHTHPQWDGTVPKWLLKDAEEAR